MFTQYAEQIVMDEMVHGSDTNHECGGHVEVPGGARSWKRSRLGNKRQWFMGDFAVHNTPIITRHPPLCHASCRFNPFLSEPIRPVPRTARLCANQRLS